MTVTKIHGCANDYLFVDCTERSLEGAPEIARVLANRRTGIGSDGLILIGPSETADFRMEMYNADGSRGAMCGNGIRGLGKYVADRGMIDGDSVRVETDSGIKVLELFRGGPESASAGSVGKVERVTVDMGEPVLEGREIPVDADGRVIDRPLEVDGRSWTVSCVSMGNPHCITFDADPDGLDLPAIGPKFEEHPFFPDGVNTEFVRGDSRTHLTMRVWERGSGETSACGTGACAVLVAAALTGRSERRATVSLPGGDLEIDYRDDGHVFMTGPAVEVFTTTVDVDPDRS
ncbi:MAG: diaminopimelate epimerase [Candidatus Binatia bacterium]